MFGSAPHQANRFLATVITDLLPNPIDIAFQSVSGLGREVTIHSLREGGENLAEYHYVERTARRPLQLTRGVLPTSPLTAQLNLAMGQLFVPNMHVIVTLLGERNVPSIVWTFENAMPTRWEVGSLDANASNVLINTFEFAYQDVTQIGSHA